MLSSAHPSYTAADPVFPAPHHITTGSFDEVPDRARGANPHQYLGAALPRIILHTGQETNGS